MSVPKSRAELKSWILRKLGAPVIEINLDDQQIDDRIDDALEFWRRYHVDAQKHDYIAHEITQADQDNRYIALDHNIVAVKTVVKPSSTAGAGSDELFNVDYQLRLNDLWDLSSVNLSGYVIARQYISLLDDILNTSVKIRYRQHDGKLYLDTDWDRIPVGAFIIIEASSYIDSEFVWGDGVLRNLAAAYCRKQWGENLIKFGGIQLPGGVVLNGETILNDAKDEITQLHNDFILKYQEPDNFYIG